MSQFMEAIKTLDEIAFKPTSSISTLHRECSIETDVGFLVVAGELRVLDQRGATTVRETTDKIGDLIAKSHRGVKVTSVLQEIPSVFWKQTQSIG